MKIVGAPVWSWKLVDSPPMSQRSHIASNGSTAICACSVACSAPSSASSGSASDSACEGSSYHSAWVKKLVGRLVGDALSLVCAHGVGHAHLAEGQPHTQRLAPVEQPHDARLRLDL